MSSTWRFAFFALALSLFAPGRGVSNDSGSSEAVILADLGIRYTPPSGMIDKTTDAVRQTRERANTYTAKAAQLLLDESSGESDESPSWHQIWMFHFPRAQLSNLSDLMAEAKVNAALAGPKATVIGQPQSRVLDGHNFLVSDFGQNEPTLTKHARVYTTICKTQLVSFVFVSNSAEQIGAMEDSLKSLSFSGR